MMLSLRRMTASVYLLVQASQRKGLCYRKVVCTSIISSGESNFFSFYSLSACQKSISLLKEFPHLCIQHCITVWQTSRGKKICSNNPPTTSHYLIIGHYFSRVSCKTVLVCYLVFTCWLNCEQHFAHAKGTQHLGKVVRMLLELFQLLP